MDSTYGGFVAPYFKEDEDVLYIPIFSVNKGRNKLLKKYDQIKTNYQNINLKDYLPQDKVEDNNYTYNLNEISVHHDPEFKTNTYGDYKSKNAIWSKLKDFGKGDYILFYGSFFPSTKSFKYKNYKLSQLRNLQSRNKQYYIFAYFKLKYAPITLKDYKGKYSEIRDNVHVIRGDFEEFDDLFVIKGTKESGYIKPFRIDSGELKGSNYQMKEMVARFKTQNPHKKGINRCYCEFKSAILKILNIKD